MEFIALVLWTVIMFFAGAVFGSRNNEDLTVRDIKKNGSFSVRGTIYLAVEKTTKDSYRAQQGRGTLFKTSINQTNSINGN